MPDAKQTLLFDEDAVFASPIGAEVAEAVEQLAEIPKSELHGSVYTKPEVVCFILDLLGYHAGRHLEEFRVLEPSFGGGDFLLAVIDRLIESMQRRGVSLSFESLNRCIQGVELHRDTFLQTRRRVEQKLSLFVPRELAVQIAEVWLTQGDFLLEPLKPDFDFVVGNPPYVRQELIPSPLLAEYRSRYSTLYDRADLYIPFFECSLSLLNATGALGFICSDRWMKNRYGGPLRAFISPRFHLAVYVDMVGTDAFTESVTAYPAITIFNRLSDKQTLTISRPDVSKAAFEEILNELKNSEQSAEKGLFKRAFVQQKGAAPWILESNAKIDLLRRIEADYPSIEDSGCEIGIGVATGSDQCFIAPFEALDVESDRKLRLVTTRDISSGEVCWLGLGVINPFADDGKLVDLGQYPRLRAYLDKRRAIIARRHCALKAPERWYRTIDRIWPRLAIRPKLLIPDIKGQNHIVYEHGELYPHHNLYYVTSELWEIRALQAVLLSNVTRLFVSTYSTEMRGGYLRFQAQYLRRLRLPRWETVSHGLRVQLSEAAISRDLKTCNDLVTVVYNLSDRERKVLADIG